MFAARYFANKKFPEAEFKQFEPRLKFKPELKIVSNLSKFKPALDWNRFLGELRRGLNSLNSDTVLFFFYFTIYCILWSISKKNDDLCNVAELDHLEILNVYTFPPVRIHLTSNSLKEFGLFKSELTYFVDLKTPNLREANYNYF